MSNPLYNFMDRFHDVSVKFEIGNYVCIVSYVKHAVPFFCSLNSGKIYNFAVSDTKYS